MTPAKLMPDLLKSHLPSSLKSGPQIAAFLALAGSASLVLVSVWVSERFLEAAIVALIWCWMRDRRELSFRMPFLLPLGLFFGWTVCAGFGAGDHPFNRYTLGKFYILLLLIVVPAIVRGTGRVVWIYRAVFAVAAVAATAGLAQFIADPHRSLMDRITGFMSTWMNYSGQLMLVLVALSAYAFCYGLGKRWWVAGLGLLIVAALVLSLTRSTLIGAAAGVGAVVLLRRPLLIAAMMAIVLLLFIAAPAGIQNRFRSGLNPEDPNTRNRIELLQTSIRLIRDHPWFGVGPRAVWHEALRYRGTNEYPDWLYQHMHNNFLQITAERGLPGLLLWLWLMGRLAWDAFRVYVGAGSGGAARNGKNPKTEALMASTAALGALAALLTAGMFEYNFGISVVMILFLYIVGAPYAFLKGGTAAGENISRIGKQNN